MQPLRLAIRQVVAVTTTVNADINVFSKVINDNRLDAGGGIGGIEVLQANPKLVKGTYRCAKRLPVDYIHVRALTNAR